MPPGARGESGDRGRVGFDGAAGVDGSDGADGLNGEVGLIGAKVIFKRDWEDAVAIGFIGLFSNSLLIGLPITERAYGSGALEGNYTIISVHSPIGYFVGITAMEIARNRGGTLSALPGKV